LEMRRPGRYESAPEKGEEKSGERNQPEGGCEPLIAWRRGIYGAPKGQKGYCTTTTSGDKVKNDDSDERRRHVAKIKGGRHPKG